MSQPDATDIITSTVTFKQRTVTGYDSYGDPIASFSSPTLTIKARIDQPKADLITIEAGYTIVDYRVMYLPPSQPSGPEPALLDHIVSPDGQEFIIIAVKPWYDGAQLIYKEAVLRRIVQSGG